MSHMGIESMNLSANLTERDELMATLEFENGSNNIEIWLNSVTQGQSICFRYYVEANCVPINDKLDTH